MNDSGAPSQLAGSADPEVSTASRAIRKAIMWSGLNSALLRLAQFSLGIVIARLIAPSEFGVFAVALTVHAIIANVSELGVTAALIRRKGSIDAIAPTVATIAIVTSMVLTGAMYGSAPWLAEIFGAEQATNAIRILSFTVLVAGATSVPYALLVREFRQDKRFFADVANFLSSTAVVIVLASEGYGATALAVSKVLGQCVSLVLLFALTTPRYRPGWNRLEAGVILRFSTPLAGASLIIFLLSNIDYVVVGRSLGALQLGYYTLAYNIAGWPVSVIGLIIAEVALPAFSHTRDDPERLRRSVIGTFALTAAVALPVSALCLALAKPLISCIYGGQWGHAAPALALLGVFGTFRILITLLTNVLASLGRSTAVLVLQIVWIAGLVPALIVAVDKYGIYGAAAAQQVVAVVLVLPLSLWLIQRSGAGRSGELLRACRLPAAAAVIAGGVSWGTAHLLTSGWLQLVVGGGAGITVYAAIAARWTRRTLTQTAATWNTGKVEPPHVPGVLADADL